MTMGKEQKMQEMIEKYRKYQEQNKGTRNYLDCMARDEMRKIAKIFQKMFHESIENYL